MSNLNRKYIQIVNTARELFWKFGIKRVTIEEICATANVSKMTFYKHFSNKNELIKQIILNMTEEQMKEWDDIRNADLPYSEKVKQMVILKMEKTNDISQEFINDYYSLNDPGLTEFLKSHTQEAIDKIQKDIIEAQKNGDVREDIKPEFIMYFLNHIPSMATDPALTTLYPDGQQVIMELINFFFYGILPHNDQIKR